MRCWGNDLHPLGTPTAQADDSKNDESIQDCGIKDAEPQHTYTYEVICLQLQSKILLYEGQTHTHIYIYIYMYVCMYVCIYGHRSLCEPHFCSKSHFPQFYSKNGQKKGKWIYFPFSGVSKCLLICGEIMQFCKKKKPYKNRGFSLLGGFRLTKPIELDSLGSLLCKREYKIFGNGFRRVCVWLFKHFPCFRHFSQKAFNISPVSWPYLHETGDMLNVFFGA